MGSEKERTRSLIRAHNQHYEEFLNGLSAITGDDVKASEAWAFWELMNGIYEFADEEGGMKNTKPNVDRLIRAAGTSTIYKYLKAAKDRGLVVSLDDRKGERYFLTDEAQKFVEDRYDALLATYRSLLKDYG
jgi:predicted transcriptional regulator